MLQRVLNMVLCLGLVAVAPTYAAAAQVQTYSAERPVGATAQSAPAYLRHAGIDQNLNSPLPIADRFRESTGVDQPLSAFFTHRPVVMALVYFKCGMLCPQVLHGMATALSQTGYAPGKDYDVVVTSIDPTDTPADTASSKQHFLSMLGNAGAASNVHFLVGNQREITDLAQAIGFHYVRVPGPDGKLNQFAHSSVIMVATPQGRMSKYLAGINYPPRDLRLAILEASEHRIGSLTDMVLLYCCSYSPSEGRYTVSVLRILGLAAVASLTAMIAMLYMLARKPKAAV